MTNENVRKQLESRGRQARFEGYSSQPGFDVEKAIARVNDLAQAQAIAQSRRLHPYRLEWIHHLEVRYRDNPGKPVIHLSDLPRKTAIRLSDNGLSMLEELWERIKRISGTRQAKRLGLENIYECGVCRRYTYITLESLHRVRQVIDWSVDSLEQYVTHIKCHKNNWPKEIQPRLPFDFLNEFGVAILAYYTESKHGTAAFTNKDMELHRFVRKAIEQTVGHMRVKTTKYEDVSETYWSLLLRTLINIAGIDTNPRQKIANNPVPLWLFSTSPSNISAYLRALWTAEGQPESMRVVQSNVVPSLKAYSRRIARHPHVTPFNDLPRQAQLMVRQRPSLLLASAVLLHTSLGIDVGFRPLYAYLEHRNEPTVMWTIEITSNEEINKFAKLINFDTTDKQQRLKTRLTQSSPSPFFLSRTLQLKSLEEMNV